MHLLANSEKSTEAHNQRPPAYWINVGTLRASDQQFFFNVQFSNVHLEGVCADVLPERLVVLHNALHLDGAFQYTRRRDRFGFDRGETGNLKLIWLVAVSPLTLFLGNGVFA